MILQQMKIDVWTFYSVETLLKQEGLYILSNSAIALLSVCLNTSWPVTQAWKSSSVMSLAKLFFNVNDAVAHPAHDPPQNWTQRKL